MHHGLFILGGISFISRCIAFPGNACSFWISLVLIPYCKTVTGFFCGGFIARCLYEFSEFFYCNRKLAYKKIVQGYFMCRGFYVLTLSGFSICATHSKGTALYKYHFRVRVFILSAFVFSPGKGLV